MTTRASLHCFVNTSGNVLETHGTIICATWAKDELLPTSPPEVSMNVCNCNWKRGTWGNITWKEFWGSVRHLECDNRHEHYSPWKWIRSGELHVPEAAAAPWRQVALRSLCRCCCYLNSFCSYFSPPSFGPFEWLFVAPVAREWAKIVGFVIVTNATSQKKKKNTTKN